MPKKSPKVIYRKLGRESAWGQAWHDGRKPTIEIDPRLGARRLMEVTIHEAVHLADPELSESKVDAMGKFICKVLWNENYRRVLLEKNSQPPKIT